MPTGLRGFALVLAATLAASAPGRVAAQDAGAGDGDEPAEAEAPPPLLPPPTLEEEEPIAPPEPEPEPEPEPPVILEHIGVGDHPDWEEENERTLPRDVAFETPDDLRVPVNQRSPSNAPRAQLPSEDPDQPPRTFELAVSGGYARLLAAEAIDFARLEERFEARLPEIESLRLGVGASQMLTGAGYLVGGGPRLGFGAFFCDGGWIQCEGVASIQPGVMGGNVLGVRFDLNATLDLRFVIEHLVELSVGGGYSLLGDTSLLHVTGQAGLVF